MGVVVTEVEHNTFGKRRAVTATVTFDSSYPAGGEAVTPGDFGLGAIDDIFFAGGDLVGTVVQMPVYDRANAKILVFQGDDGTVVDDTTDLSTAVFRAMVIGRP